MRYMVGLAVSVWLVCVSHGWVSFRESLPDDLLLLVCLISAAVSASGVFDAIRAIRGDRDVAVDVVGRHVAVAVIGGLALSLSLVVRDMGVDLGALQACILSFCGGGLTWGFSRIVLRRRGYVKGSWQTDAVVAGAAAAGGNLTLVWIYGLPAMRFLAENATWILGILGIVGFGVLALANYVGDDWDKEPDVPPA